MSLSFIDGCDFHVLILDENHLVVSMRPRMGPCFIHLLPTETLCSILKAALEDIVEQDMMGAPNEKDRVLVGDLPFPNTMALVCRRWRDIVSSAPELWTRIFCILPEGRDAQTLDFQLKKAGNSIPIDLTILADFGCKEGLIPDDKALLSIAPHVRRLRSLRIHCIMLSWIHHPIFDALTGDTPLLECLRLSYLGDVYGRRMWQPLLGLKCPRIRVFAIQGKLVHYINHQWLKENLADVKFVTISRYGYRYNATPSQGMWNPFPRWIPCLILDQVDISSEDDSLQIGAEKLILRGGEGGVTSTFIDDNCKIIAMHGWDIFRERSWFRRLPLSNTLEFDGCQSSSPLQSQYMSLRGPKTYTWNGDTVIIMNSNLHTIDIVLAMLMATSEGHKGFMVRWGFMWPRVTTLTLMARDDFVMELPVEQLKAMINCRWKAAGKSGTAKAESNDMNYKGVLPIMMLRVYGGPPLSHSDRSWFKEKVKDFVWDYKER